MARIDPLTQSDDPVGQKIIDGAAATGSASPANLFGTLAHHPDLARRALRLGRVFLFEGTLEPRIREIAILRTAWRTEAEYEWGQHTLLARDLGFEEHEIRDLMTPALVGDWSDLERTVVDAVDDLCGHDAIRQDTWIALAATYAEPQLVELTLLVGYYRMLSGLMNSVEVDRDEGVPGWS
jgi:alkylhydroperoxidase family enzyme